MPGKSSPLSGQFVYICKHIDWMMIMVRLICTFVLLYFGLVAMAQHDPVLMRINGKDILRSEFEYAYNKNTALSGRSPKSLHDYANYFADCKLKVASAEAAGLDTVRTFREELDGYRRQLIESYLTDKEASERAASQSYDKMKSKQRTERILVQHIFKYLPQNISGYSLRQMESKMDSVYATLSKDGASFEACVESLSDAKKPFWLGRLQMPIEFEDVVFSLPVGEISRPFFTPQGIHIAKVLERKDILPFEEVKDEIIRRQTRSYELDKGTQAMVEKLKKEYRYTPDQVGINELFAKGSTDRNLFTLDGKSYSGKDFARFAAAHPEGVRRQLDGFVVKSILDYENSRLESKHPEFRLLVEERREAMLLSAITALEIGKRSTSNEADLKAYFEAHRSDYHWKEPHYKGIVLHCTTKRVAKQVRKFLKQIPEEEWMDAIRLTFNAGPESKVQAQQGLFAPGDNVYVDDLVFKGEDAPPVLSFPFTAVMGKKKKGPDSFQEVLTTLETDYQNYLKARWTSRLRAAGKVEIDQEVLKTVNNH